MPVAGLCCVDPWVFDYGPWSRGSSGQQAPTAQQVLNQKVALHPKHPRLFTAWRDARRAHLDLLDDPNRRLDDPQLLTRLELATYRLGILGYQFCLPENWPENPVTIRAWLGTHIDRPAPAHRSRDSTPTRIAPGLAPPWLIAWDGDGAVLRLRRFSPSSQPAEQIEAAVPPEAWAVCIGSDMLYGTDFKAHHDQLMNRLALSYLPPCELASHYEHLGERIAMLCINAGTQSQSAAGKYYRTAAQYYALCDEDVLARQCNQRAQSLDPNGFRVRIRLNAQGAQLRASVLEDLHKRTADGQDLALEDGTKLSRLQGVWDDLKRVYRGARLSHP